MRHTIAIVAHLERRHQAEQLRNQTGAHYIHWDNGKLGATQSHHNTWQTLRDHATTPWSVVLEDDAQPVHDFTHQLDAALAAAPAPIVSLYLGRQRPPQYQTRIQTALAQAKHAGAHWITAPKLLHAVAIAIQTHLLPTLLNHQSTTLPPDERISAWARHHQHTIAYTIPSLTNHADGQTLIKHRDGQPRPPGRTAWTTGTRPHWNNKAVPL